MDLDLDPVLNPVRDLGEFIREQRMAAQFSLRALAAELDLIVTGSSDYHGTNKTVRLGAETTAPEMLDALAERATGSKILVG